MYPKFIITSAGEFRLGMVFLHKHLLEPGDECLGGGYYKFDYAQGMIQLSGESSDFGKPQWDAIDTLLVSREYEGLSLVYFPGSLNGYAINLAELLTIKYI